MVKSLLLLLLITVQVSTARAEPFVWCDHALSTLGGNVGGNYSSPALDNLVKDFIKTKRGLLSQQDWFLRSRAKACGVICGINAIQTIKAAIGDPLLPRPASIANDLETANPALAQGLRPTRIGETLRDLVKTFLPGREVAIEAESLNFGLASEDRNLVKVVNSIDSTEIGSGHGLVQILTYVVFRNEQNLGSHTVTLLRKSGKSVSIIDPNLVEVPAEYDLEPINITDLHMKTLEFVPTNPAAIALKEKYGDDAVILLHTITNVRAGH